VALALYGLYRWPLEYTSRGEAGRFSFAKDSSPWDRVLGTADYLACVILFLAGPVFRYRKTSPAGAEERLPDWEVLDMICVIASILGALSMILVSVGAVLSLVRS